MYSKTSKSMHMQSRSGSFSTHGTGSGKVDVMPPHARREEHLYQGIKEQWASCKAHMDGMNAEVARINLDLTGTASADDKRLMRKRRDELGEQLQRVQSELGVLRRLMRDAGEMSYCGVFYHVASSLMPMDIFKKLDAEVQSIMSRSRHEIRRGTAIPQKPLQREIETALARYFGSEEYAPPLPSDDYDGTDQDKELEGVF